MHQRASHTDTGLDKAMNPEQFNQIVEAILAGKYSWACVLILRFSGYNPLHYIPYRTYNRLLKDNCPPRQKRLNKARTSEPSEQATANERCTKISDLAYLEAVSDRHSKVRGGGIAAWFR
jgi:hypothetical protein